ncbi:MAG TPA: hypothetical protein VGF32_06095 [Streptosporangiaceae bacterium]
MSAASEGACAVSSALVRAVAMAEKIASPRAVDDVEELHRAEEKQQQLAAAGCQQRSGWGGHEISLQDWTD